MSDHERIWLEPAPGADEEYGRQWCQHNVFGDEATEYVRADLPLSPLKVEGPSMKAIRAALEFYASEANWNDGHFVEDDEPNCITLVSSTIDKDQGKLARSTLVEHDETAERETE